MKYLSILIFSLLLFFSCEKTVILDEDQFESVMVIEGLITNELKQHSIQISRTGSFYATGENPPVSGAIVQVTDQEGLTHIYEEIADGQYVAQEAFAGRIGQSYTLNIEVEGQTYTASETMNAPLDIQEITYRINEDEQEDPDEEGLFYELLLYATEPQETKEYYMFNFFRNGEPENFNGEEIYLWDDEYLGESLNGVPSPMYFAEGDVARVEVHSISLHAYKYFADLYNNINNDGGMFSGQPANPRSNLSGGAVGYFQSSDTGFGKKFGDNRNLFFRHDYPSQLKVFVSVYSLTWQNSSVVTDISNETMMERWWRMGKSPFNPLWSSLNSSKI